MNITDTFSSFIGPLMVRYITLKQALGRKFDVEARVLKNLDLFLSDQQSDLTAQSFEQWCCAQQHLTTGVRRNWMRITRNFCLYRQHTEPSCFIPDQSQFPLPHQAVQPHIFTQPEIIQLLEATQLLKPRLRSPLRPENIRLALVLLYTAGLRRGELLRLILGDYNPIEHTLLIRQSKFHKSRLIPLSYDAWKEVENYLKIRSCRQFPSSNESPLIWNSYRSVGTYSKDNFGRNFRFLFRATHIHTASGNLPRLHDFRHSFAVQALVRWYQEGADIQA
jgi:integrase/recombinase XerD